MNYQNYNGYNNVPPPPPNYNYNRYPQPPKDNTVKTVLIVVGAVFAFFLFIIFAGAIFGGDDKATAQADSTQVAKRNTNKTVEWCKWKYSTDYDFMENEEIRFAIAKSMPRGLKNGEHETLKIGVRKKKNKDDVYLELDHLTFYGNEFNGTKYITFKEGLTGKPIKFNFSWSNDLDVKYVWLDNPKSFIKQMKKAKVFYIEIPTFTSGRGIFEFVVGDSTLVWK